MKAYNSQIMESAAAREKKKAKKPEWGNLLGTFLPYLVIAAATLAVFYVWIGNSFITGGDDFQTHLGLVYDLAYGFEHGFVMSTNHVYLGIFAYNASLFYGMLPHYSAAVLKTLFSFAGADLIGSMKTVSILFAFLGGVYAYKLFLKATHNRAIALAGALAFCFLPYKIYCYFYRFAWSEAIALNFMPMFFYAVYAILHDDKLRPGPFVTLVLSAAFLVTSHPFTALVTIAGGALLGLCNVVLFVRKAKDWRFDLYLGTSLLLGIGMVFFFLFPMLQATASGLYRVSNSEVMWTTLSHIVDSMKNTNQFAGILDFGWAERMGVPLSDVDSASAWIFGLVAFPLLSILGYLVDWLLAKKVPLKAVFKLPLRLAVLFLILFVPFFVVGARIEIYLALALYFLSYALFFVLPLKAGEGGKGLKKAFLDLAKDGSFYACLFLAVIGFLYLYVAFVWEISPSILYTAQFAFRFWGIATFALLFLFVLLVKALSKYRASIAFALMVATCLFTLSMGVVDKRIYNVENGHDQFFEPDQSWIMGRSSFGAQNEYMPEIIYDLYYGEAEESYPGSQAKEIAIVFLRDHRVLYGEEDYSEYLGFLEGDLAVEAVISLNTPDVDLLVSSEGPSLLQLPQFYYEGYEATAVYGDGTRLSCPVSNVDGLLAVSLPSGAFALEVRYPGPALRVAGFYLLGFSLAGTVAMGLSGFALNRKKRGGDSQPSEGTEAASR